MRNSWDAYSRYPPPALALAPAQQTALAAAVDTGLRERGCDNTLLSWAGLRAQLEANGGYCDCEILFNVLPPDESEPD